MAIERMSGVQKRPEGPGAGPDIAMLPVPRRTEAGVDTFRPDGVTLAEDQLSVQAAMKRLLEKAGLSQREVAKRLGLANQTINSYLSGAHFNKRPSVNYKLQRNQ